MSENYSTGSNLSATDTLRIIENKILMVLNAGGGDGGGAANIKTSAVDPNGVVDCLGPGICLGSGAQAGAIWAKTSGALSNNEWVLIIAP